MSGIIDVTRFNRVRPPRKSRKIVMRLSSLNELRKKELNGFLLIEKPTGLSRSKTALGQRLSSRPPLRPDLEGPTPCTYSVQLPAAAVRGTKINPRSKYSRDALPNPSTDIWTYNISLAPQTPGPTSYISPTIIGQSCPVFRHAPAFSVTPRRPVRGVVPIPGPDAYNSAKAMEHTLKHHPAFSMAAKTDASRSVPSTPGPAHYHPQHFITKHHSPAFSMQQRRENNMRTF